MLYRTAWLRSKKALKHLRSHLGHIQVIPECYSPATSFCCKTLNPCILNIKCLQFCYGTYQVGQQHWLQLSSAATATGTLSSKDSWRRQLWWSEPWPRTMGDPPCLQHSKLSFPRSALTSTWKPVSDTQWTIWGRCADWSRLRHVCHRACRGA